MSIKQLPSINTNPDKNNSKETSGLKELPKKVEKIDIDDYIRLDYPTNHLNGFKELRQATRLFGKEYVLIIKAIWYNILSSINPNVALELNQLQTDGRIHLLIPLKSGKGKKELKRVIKTIMKELLKTVDEPTSLHPEQLVGKTIRRPKKGSTEYEHIPGFFSRDYLIIDEGRTLLTSNELLYSESRRYLRLALDPYPHNTISKKPVDVPFGEELEYSTYVVCSIFTQPYSFCEDFATDGDLRRFLVPYVNMSGIDRKNAYRMRIEDQSNSEISINAFIQYTKSLKNIETYHVSDEGKHEFLRTFDILIDRGFSYSYEIRNFVDIYDFTIQDLLLKMSAIQALQANKDVIQKEHVTLAAIDLFEFLEHLYLFVEKKIKGSLNYGEEWRGAIKEDVEALMFLANEGAFSKESSNVSIKGYKQKIMELRDLEDERQARRYFHTHEKNGWVKSKKGQHNSKVWLAFKPEEESSMVRTVNKKDFQKEYNSLLKIVEEIPITTLTILNNKKEIIEVIDHSDHSQNIEKSSSQKSIEDFSSITLVEDVNDKEKLELKHPLKYVGGQYGE